MNYKKYILLPMLLFIILPIILFLGCRDDDDSSSNYRIEFTLDGTEYVFTQGFDDPTGIAEGHLNTSGTRTLVVARSADNSDNYVYLDFAGLAEGVFHDIVSRVSFEYVIVSDNNYLDDSTTADDLTYTITEYGSVGGCIKGTFSGDVTRSVDGTTHVITDGYFEVIRRTDGSISMQ